MPGMLSRGILIGDVRVTLVDRVTGRSLREFEGVQKVYPVAANMAMGFAGNIDAGLTLVGDLTRNVAHVVPEGHAFDQPSRFLFAWRRRARWAWREVFDETLRAGGCSLLWIGALPHDGGPFQPTVGYVLRAPGFEPERIAPRTAEAIGSGAHIREYAAELVRLGEEWFELAQFEVAGLNEGGGVLIPMATIISELIEERLPSGISPHLHLCSVRFGEVSIGTNDVRGFGRPDRTMPLVAETYAQWQAMKEEQGIADLLAVG
jgi:hypothetical protein